MEIDKFETIEQIADAVLKIFPEQDIRKYDVKVLGRMLTLKDRFVVYFKSAGVKPRKFLNSEYIEKFVLIKVNDKKFDINNLSSSFEAFNDFFEYI